MEPISEFLSRFAPFDRLEPEELDRVAAAVEERHYPIGTDVLVEDGLPATAFYVIRRGAMALLHEEEVIDVLASGECFGHPSLLTGMAPAFTVRAHEDSVCYLVPRDVALDVLGRPAGARFVATSLRERLTRTGHTVHALPELRSVHVTALLTRPPVFCPPDASIREAARLMTEGNASAILVRNRDGLAIVTDHDLRTRVVAGDVPTDAPVATVMRSPVVTTSTGRLAFDAMIDMLENGVHHLPVVDGAGEVVGVISADDLVNLEGRNPFALRRAIAHARDEDELERVASRLRTLFVTLLDSGLSPRDIGRVLALQSDSATIRLIDIAVGRLGQPPVPWAWLALGSAARRELTLASDQDNALAYASSDADQEVDGYFARLAEIVNRGLARCGFGADAADVVASDRKWRMTDRAWLEEFRACLETPDRSHLVRAAVAFDFRHVIGGLDVTPGFTALVRGARDYQGFLARLARTATDVRPPLLRRGVVQRLRQEAPALVDVKAGATLPITNLARFHALANGITISSTVDRLEAVERIGALDSEVASALREAFALASRLRLEHHAACIQAGRDPDNVVDPAELPPLTRAELREAFQVIAAAQKQLAHYVPLGL